MCREAKFLVCMAWWCEDCAELLETIFGERLPDARKHSY